MRVLVLASIPYGGLRRRQQQVACGLASSGHTVLYVEPPRPFRSLIDPARFELGDLAVEPASDTNANKSAASTSSSDPSACADDSTTSPAQAPWPALVDTDVSQPMPGLTVANTGIGMARMGAWGWAARVGWKLWADKTRRLLAPLDPDISLVYHPALLRAARESLNAPLVFECLDDFPSLAPSTAIAAAYEEALQDGLPIVDGFLTVNRYLLESWERYLRPEAVRRVVEHGVDLALFQPAAPESRRQARAALQLGAGEQVAGYLGRFDARVSFADIERMLAAEPALLVLLLGEVSTEGEAMLRRLPAERIRRVGPLSQEQAAALLPAADVLILPFLREPHLEAIRGLKLYEYLATGIPVLASFRRGIKVFREQLYLYTDFAELEDGLRSALREPFDAPQRAARSRVAEEAGWSRRIVEIEAFLAEVLASRRA